MSELSDKQVNAEKAHEKMCDENERKKRRVPKIFLWAGRSL